MIESVDSNYSNTTQNLQCDSDKVKKPRYSLRAASQADFEFLYNLKKSCLEDYVAATWGWDESFQRSHFVHHFNPANTSIIIVDGTDVGELSLEERAGGIYLAGIYILPSYQGKGLGTAILQELIEHAQAQKLALRLQVLRVNPARGLYERLGFRIVAENETHYQMTFE